MSKAKVSPVISVTLDGEEYGFTQPSTEDWDRFLEKVRQDKERAGQREILGKSCTLGHEKCAAALDKRPALIKRIYAELDKASGSSIEFVAEMDSMTFSANIDGEDLVFDSPDVAKYETLQTNLEDKKLKYGPVLRSALGELAQDKELFRRLVTKYPTMIGPAFFAMGQVAGNDIEITVKKG